MTTELRRATVGDIPHLARFAIEAYGGYFEVLYDGLAPDQSTESLIQSSFLQPDTTPFYEHHWVAMHDGRAAGGMHAFPMEDIAGFPLDPLVPEERYMAIDEDLNHIQAPGTYYIHVLTIYPEFHRKRIASTLLSLALKQTAEKGIAECSLFVFAKNVGAIALYEKHGFKEAARAPVTEHPLLYYTGDMLLMTCVV